jgi:hypothetical protein
MKAVQIMLNFLLVLLEGASDCFPFDNKKEGEDEEDEEKCRQAMRPDIDAFVVQHEEALQNARRSVEINTISMSYAQVVLHELWCLFVLPDKVLFLMLIIPACACRLCRRRLRLLLGVVVMLMHEWREWCKRTIKII